MMETAGDVINSSSSGVVLLGTRVSSYGHRTQDYRKIVRKVVHEREVRDAIAALQQRLNMLQLMKGDAQELIDKRRQKITTSRTKLYMESVVTHFLPILVVLFSLVLVLYAGQWILHTRKWR